MKSQTYADIQPFCTAAYVALVRSVFTRGRSNPVTLGGDQVQVVMANGNQP